MFTYTSIQQYHTDLLNGSVTCTDTVQHFLSAIESRSNLNAYTQVFATEALEKAKALDQSRKEGKPLG
ncbi:MAG TPA: hypothetical protein VM488_19020, partial [Pseudobacter sp.]|nr:hypothetical protein [Pseudobacter sp.]